MYKTTLSIPIAIKIPSNQSDDTRHITLTKTIELPETPCASLSLHDKEISELEAKENFANIKVESYSYNITDEKYDVKCKKLETTHHHMLANLGKIRWEKFDEEGTPLDTEIKFLDHLGI